MSESAIVNRLTTAIQDAIKSANFCTSGDLLVADPEIFVDGLGEITFPLKRGKAKELIVHCAVAPYGKGTQTLVDTKVRKTFELDPTQFRLSDGWNSMIAETTRSVAAELGLPADELEPSLYKLLVYEKGGFFVPHRDSEKNDRMVASMVVVLPNPFEGGSLVVRHGGKKEKFEFKAAKQGKATAYAAFYADCEHEVEQVSSGMRVCMTYNLSLKAKPKQRKRTTEKPTTPSDSFVTSLYSYLAKQPAKPLVFALEHYYTERGLSLDLLKGADRELADIVAKAAEQVGCVANLAQVSRHLCQSAEDPEYDYGYRYGHRYGYRRQKPSLDDLDIGETYEDDLSVTDWTSLDGKKEPWSSIPLDLSAIVSSVPIDDWKPTTEEYEGYTGNAGNTLDRWYHRSAIVIWHRDHHFDVLATSDLKANISVFCSMVAKLAKTPKSKLANARADCIRFAQAIIARWPRNWHEYDSLPKQYTDLYRDFVTQVQNLQDRDTVAMFLTKMVENDAYMPLNRLIKAACQEFGWNAFALELKQLISARPEIHGRQEIPYRDIDWLSDYCCDKAADPERITLANDLCKLAVEGFCQPQSTSHIHWRGAVSEKSLPLLVKALVAMERHNDLARVVDFVLKSPKEFGVQHCQVPGLILLIPWSRKRSGSVPKALAAWLSAVRKDLEAATATHPKEPKDWTRAANIACKCKNCTELNAFLADPVQDIHGIRAPEDGRQHMIALIQRHRSDVSHTLDTKGRPYTLVLKKTSASYQAAVKEFEKNRELLESLPITQ